MIATVDKMKKLIHNKIKYELPENWKDLKLGTFEQLMNLPFDPELETDYKIKFISICSGIDEETISNVDQEQFDYLWSCLNWIVEKPKNGRLNKLFKIGDELYYSNSNLNDEIIMNQFKDA